MYACTWWGLFMTRLLIWGSSAVQSTIGTYKSGLFVHAVQETRQRVHTSHTEIQNSLGFCSTHLGEMQGLPSFVLWVLLIATLSNPATPLLLLSEPRRLPIVLILTWYVTRSPQFLGAILECSEMIKYWWNYLWWYVSNKNLNNYRWCQIKCWWSSCRRRWPDLRLNWGFLRGMRIVHQMHFCMLKTF